LWDRYTGHHQGDPPIEPPLHYIPFVSPHLLPPPRVLPTPCEFSDCSECGEVDDDGGWKGCVPMTQDVWRSYFGYAMIARFRLFPAEMPERVASLIADYVMMLLWEPAYERWRLGAIDLYRDWRREHADKRELRRHERESKRETERQAAADEMMAATREHAYRATPGVAMSIGAVARLVSARQRMRLALVPHALTDPSIPDSPVVTPPSSD
jgi:hypothetical protein